MHSHHVLDQTEFLARNLRRQLRQLRRYTCCVLCVAQFEVADVGEDFMEIFGGDMDNTGMSCFGDDPLVILY